jgi:type I restriction enzyme S subunit
VSLRRYPRYRDSGVEWLGEVPEHWEVKRLKYLSPQLTVGIVVEPSKFYADEGVPALRSLNILPGAIKLENLVFITQSGHELHSKSRLRAGDLVAVRSGQPGTAAVIPPELDGCNCIDLIIVRKPSVGSGWFLCWYLASEFALLQFSVGSEGAIQQHFNVSTAGELVVAVPPATEQVAIVEHLNVETAKIDALVAEQQRLVELLKEKRQAVISHAVTKGLNPNAPMKDSGIEWLGDVPAHWEVLKGSLIGTLFGSEQVPEAAVRDEGDLPFIKVGSLSRESFEVESWDYFIDRAVVGDCKSRSGYIVFPKRGAAIFANKVNIVHVPSLIDPNLMGWQIGDRAVTAFIAYALKSRRLDELADVSTVPQINNKHIAPERFPVPPAEEQHEIVAFLNLESAKLDNLTAEAQRAIELLQERRTALISAAVTGKIDVRP